MTTIVLAEEELSVLKSHIQDRLNWDGPLFCISAVTHQGLEELKYAVMAHVEAQSVLDGELEGFIDAYLRWAAAEAREAALAQVRAGKKDDRAAGAGTPTRARLSRAARSSGSAVFSSTK